MKETAVALASSRKFWVGTINVVAIFAAVLLAALKIIPESSLIPTISAITATALGVIGSIGWEDVATKKASAPPAPSVTNNVNNS